MSNPTLRSLLALPEKPSIAVLPFEHSGDTAWFADGMVADIITGLSRIKWLFVIARNSSFIYRGRAAEVKQVGRDLGVRYVLEGSVRRSADRVRINVQLADSTDGTHVWAERYDRTLSDVFALQDEIALAVVSAIEPSLRRAEIERIKRKRPDSLDAYELVLRAQPDVDSGMPDRSAAALPLLMRALALDPAYALAHGLAAMAHHNRFLRAGLKEQDRTEAVRHARLAHGDLVLSGSANRATPLTTGWNWNRQARVFPKGVVHSSLWIGSRLTCPAARMA